MLSSKVFEKKIASYVLFINKRIFCVPCFIWFLLTFKMWELFLPHPVQWRWIWQLSLAHFIPMHLTTLCHRLYKYAALTEKHYFSCTQVFVPLSQIYRTIRLTCFCSFTSSHLQGWPTRINAGIFLWHIRCTKALYDPWSMLEYLQYSMVYHTTYNTTLSLRWWITENFYLHHPTKYQHIIIIITYI